MAISDVLSEAVEQIDTYLKGGQYAAPFIMERLAQLRREMDGVRELLDLPPPSFEVTVAEFEAMSVSEQATHDERVYIYYASKQSAHDVAWDAVSQQLPRY